MSLHYLFSVESASQHLLKIELTIPASVVKKYASKNQLELQFPAWRPGRYELANFAKNLLNIRFSQGSSELGYRKIHKDKFLVDLKGKEDLKIVYHYYAHEMNAGSTWVDENQLYVNPVNCCMYILGAEELPVTLSVKAPKSFKVATSLEKKGTKYKAASIHELMDSPFIASNQLQHDSWEQSGVTFHLWFNGQVSPDTEKIKRDFKKYTAAQIKAFGKFPVDEFHYLFQILPYKHYHGVEHLKSTVISLGPDYELMEKELYESLLGVSSHELYHVWNIKSIRPIEMHPYDYSQENYSRMGYLAEGVTTYMGDLMLLKGKVFSTERYLEELTGLIQRHVDNFGRTNMSVADSSYDTWLDGYTPGIPNRKVSIYNEGALIAFICDVHIMKETKGSKSLSDVMRYLYEQYAKKSKGVSEEDYLNALNKVSGVDMSFIFDKFINAPADYLPEIKKALKTLGMKLAFNTCDNSYETHFGFKTDNQSRPKIISIYPHSPAEKAGLHRGDELIAANNYLINNNLKSIFQQFKQDVTLTLNRQEKLLGVTLKKSGVWFRKPTITHNPEHHLFKKWRK